MEHRSKRSWRGRLGCSLISIFLAIGVWLTYPHDHLLTEAAHPIYRFDNSSGPQQNAIGELYWLSATRLLIVTTDHEGELLVDYWRGHADLLDLPTRTRTRLKGLTDLFNQQDYGPWDAPSDWTLSPGGTWLHYQNFRHGGRERYNPAVSTLDARQHREWEFEEGATFWLDDNHHVEVLYEAPDGQRDRITGLMIRDARDARRDRKIAASTAEARTILKQYHQSHPLSEDGTSDDALHRFDGPLPNYTRVIFRYDSPAQNAVLYHVRRDEIPPFLEWLHRFIPAALVKPAVTEELWMSDTGTHRMKELGHMPAKVDQNGNLEAQVVQIQWLPDGKQISFVYGGTLYVMPVTTSK